MNDYTINNSAISRFFHGHWNRHHVKDAANIINLIDNQSINTPETLIRELNKISIINPFGSLARRINFITYEWKVLQEHDQSLASHEAVMR